MAVKKKQPNTPKADPKAQFRVFLNKLSATFNAHGVLIMFIIAGSVIGFSLVRSRGYLNPERDETRYSEGTAKNNFGSVDYSLVTRLQESLKNANINVSQSIDPNRKNPFDE